MSWEFSRRPWSVELDWWKKSSEGNGILKNILNRKYNDFEDGPQVEVLKWLRMVL